jgi:hypothetical protein
MNDFFNGLCEEISLIQKELLLKEIDLLIEEVDTRCKIIQSLHKTLLIEEDLLKKAKNKLKEYTNI